MKKNFGEKLKFLQKLKKKLQNEKKLKFNKLIGKHTINLEKAERRPTIVFIFKWPKN